MQDYIPREIEIDETMDPVVVNQYDHLSRFLWVQIFDKDLDESGNHKPLDLTACVPQLYIDFGDDALAYIDGEVADGENGIVSFLIPNGATQTPGSYTAQIIIIDPTGNYPQLSTKTFAFIVEKSVRDTVKIEATGQFSALENATNLVYDLRARVNNLTTLKEGSTTGDAELMDIRVGHDGTVYDSAGNAVRKQISLLNDDTKNLADGNGTIFVDSINGLYGKPVTGCYIGYHDGKEHDNTDYAYYYVKITGGTYYNAASANCHIAFFDENHEYISGTVVTDTKVSFQAPDEAVYLSYSYNRSTGAQYLLKSTRQALAYVDNSQKMLGLNVGLSFEHFTPIIKTGKNLFNQFHLIKGYCFGYTFDRADAISWLTDYCFCPDFIPCEANTAYTLTNYAVICEYDAARKPVAVHNITTDINHTFTTDSAAVWLRVGCKLVNAPLVQVEKGTVATDYEPFYIEFVNGKPDSSGFFTVSGSGGGDYRTISEACAAAKDGDTVYIKNGVYKESVHIYSKRLNLIGESKEGTILTYSGLDYHNPPLEMAKGTLKNLTIHATNSGTAGSIPTAYCMHTDNDNELNQSLYVENVKFINDVHQVVGIGLRGHFTLEFNGCDFICNCGKNALYCHSWETSDTSADLSGQNLIVRNCTIFTDSNSTTSVMLQSQELKDKAATVLLQRNVIVNSGSGGTIGMSLWAGRTLTNTNYLGSSDWVLSPLSELSVSEQLKASVATMDEFSEVIHN